MAGDETILDAPVTPAPLFAYRALKGMFFGSPETPVNANNYTDGHNKENENIAESTQHDVARAKGLSPKRLTSQNIANAMLSPTKSCLRTPGATPRRELRDINVTFMDIRSSEVRQKASESSRTQRPLHEIPIHTTQTSRAKTTTKSNIAKPKQVHNIAVSKSHPQEPQSQSQPQQQTISFDVQTYKDTTEKEMKKLIRYSIKMREYARKQDEDNAKLKQLVEELQRENARLKRKAEAEADEIDTTKKWTQPEPERKDKHAQHKKQDNHKRRKIDATNTNANINMNADTNVAHLRQKANVHAPAVPGKQAIDIPLRPLSNVPFSVATSNALNLNVMSSGLAPDRLAAARARLRQRSEVRRASHIAELDGRKDVASAESRKLGSKSKSDSSMLDWAGL